MLESSAAFAELRQWNLDITGTERVVRGLDLITLLDIYDSVIAPVGNTYQLELPDNELQSAWLADLERSYTRFAVQLSTYGVVVKAGIDPMWTAVTGYYASFMGGTALLSAVGQAARSLGHGIGPIARGLHTFTTAGSPYPGRTLLVVKRTPQDSHRYLWRSLVDRLGTLAIVDRTDARSNGVLDSLADLIQRPIWLSDFRNRINYSVDEEPSTATMWASEMKALTERGRIEDRVAGSMRLRDEQRLELVALSCASLLSALYRDYLTRANRPDPRPAKWRNEYLSNQEDDDFRAALLSHLL